MEMNQQNLVSQSFHTPDVTIKKKRGRPRKDPTQSPAKTTYVPRKRDISQHHGERAPVPPGFEEADGSQPQLVNPVNNNSLDSMVGQVVTGVIEAVFDAGFLLSVRVGDSNTSLRGVVFKTGHYVPVNAANDLAPGVQMIRRNEVPFPVETQTHKHRHMGRKGSQHIAVYQSNGSPGSNQVARVRGRELAIVPAQPPQPDPLESRGTLVPVVLRPVNLSNGTAPAVEVRPIASQPAHLAALKGKHTGPTQVVQEVAAKGSFDELLSVAKKMKVGHSGGILNDNVNTIRRMSCNNSGLTQEEGQDLSKPLFVEPLQTIHSSLAAQSTPMARPFPERSTGKMTELLLAVQENLMERQMSHTQHQEFKNPEK